MAGFIVPAVINFPDPLRGTYLIHIQRSTILYAPDKSGQALRANFL